MKGFFVFATVCLCLTLSACQCSNKPDIGPVEEGVSAQVDRPQTDQSAPDAA